tara:strand:- start:486 stop:1601 length:1116 start_codon:yes stop_codon:yes gene_type:complete
MKFFDLSKQYQKISKSLDKELKKNFLTGDFIQGNNVKILEKKLLEFINSSFCLTCANGTDAIKLALKSLNIKKNSYVIVPSYTWISTASSVVECGFRPLFCDVNIDTFVMDKKNIEQTIKFAKKNKLTVGAIISVDLFGNPVDYKTIQKICKKENIFFISDAAQSFGAKNGKAYIGTNDCDILTTSFFPTKTLGCYGDGGALFFNNKEIFNKAKTFAKNGQDPKGLISSGFNSRLDTIQATILLEKIKYLKKENIQKQNIYNYYSKNLNKEILDLQKINPNNLSGYSVMTIKLKKEVDRSLLIEYLRKNNIPSKVYYSPPLHKSKYYNKFPNIKMINTEYLSLHNLSLPIYPYIELKKVKTICDIINKFKN